MVRDSAKGTGRKKKTIEKVYGVAEIKDELIDVALLSQFFMIIENRRKQKFENWKSMRQRDKQTEKRVWVEDVIPKQFIECPLAAFFG